MKKVYLHRAKHQIARPTTVRDINKRIVLNYVRDRSPISRADIARQTALQRSTVSAIVEDLKTAELVEEIGTGNSTGGRKPTMLRLKTGVPAAIGVDVEPSRVIIAVADLAGVILEKEMFPTNPDELLMSDEITRRVARIAEKYRALNLEIGVSVPGITDQLTGKVLYVPYFQWRDWDISRQLQKKTGLRVTIENDANALALAELWFGERKIRNTRNFIAVLVGEGIGTGIIFDGQIYRGEKGAAGEFGHMIVGENAPVECSCGSYDCWEAMASEKATVARYCILTQTVKSGRNCPTMNEVIDRALAGEPVAVKVLRETGKYLGIGISNLIVGLSPQAVIVSGDIARAWNIIAGDLQEYAERSVRSGLSKTDLMASSLGGSPALTGALSLVLARKFASAH